MRGPLSSWIILIPCSPLLPRCTVCKYIHSKVNFHVSTVYIYIYIYIYRSSRHVARSTHVCAPQPFRPTERAAMKKAKAGIALASLAALSTQIHLIHMRAYIYIYIYIHHAALTRPPRRGREAASAAAAAEDAI